MQIKERFTNIRTQKVLDEKIVKMLLEEDPIALKENCKLDFICPDCGNVLKENKKKRRTNTQQREEYWYCESCNAEYKQFALHYPDEVTRNLYSTYGTWSKVK